MSEKKHKQSRQEVRKETGLSKDAATTYKPIVQYTIPGNPAKNLEPLDVVTRVCTGLRGAYRKAKQGA